MIRLLRYLRILCLAAAWAWVSASALHAQNSAPENAPNTELEIERGEGARAYADTLRFSRIQRDIFYIDELNQPIPMNGLPRFERRKEPDPEIEDIPDLPAPLSFGERWGWFAFFAVLAGVVIYLVHRFGDGIGASFQKRPDGGTRETRRNGNARPVFKPETPTELLLAQLRGMADRREALVALIEHLLPAAAHQNGIRLGRAETAREIIRRLPVSWALLSELKRIVMTEELVQFGGRELPERTFEDCLRRAVPILEGAVKRGMAA